MARAAGTTIENSFRQGLITEATGMNFPENACTDTFDCVFDLTGEVSRRLGFDFENNYATKTQDRTACAISTYYWKNVSGNGLISVFVVQVGGTLLFYDVSRSSISAGIFADTVLLSGFADASAPDPSTQECQFSNDSKYLIVTHPYCKPFYVSYDSGALTFDGTGIDLYIRDFEGDTADTLDIDERPTTTLASIDIHHKYNLLNQGWNTTNLTAWDTSQTTMPSNADVMWTFKNASDAFDTTTIPNVMRGNTPAPKGHYVLKLADEDRVTVSGISGVTNGGTNHNYPTTSAFYAGRIFYAGINYAGKNSNIYFTQIIERDEQYGNCYQAADPTSEEIFDPTPADGGVISIREAGTIYKLIAVSGSLVVFANNGVWAITGSQGLGFSATDYTVIPISTLPVLSASSFVDVAGYPAWWTADGIYMLTTDGNSPQVKSLTLGTIKTFYDEIPTKSKGAAKGYFHTITGVIQWVYRATDADDLTGVYSYNRVMNYNIASGAFYPWTISSSDVTVNGIVVLGGTQGATEIVNVISGTDNVISGADNVVATQFNQATSGSSLQFTYLVSYPDSGSWKFTFAGANSLDYVDWKTFGDSTVYTSYFVTGYKIHGDGIRRFSPTYVNIFSSTPVATSYSFQGVWDYSISDTKRWSVAQTITHTNLDYSTSMARLKVRGHGRVLQYKVTSDADKPFFLTGWSAFETGNAIP